MKGLIGFVCIIIALCFYLSFGTGGSPHSNILLGVRLPAGVLKEQEVIELARRFKKANRSIFFVFIVLALPMLKLEYPSLLLLYMMVWCLLYYIAGNWCFLNYFDRILLMKSKNHWFPGDCHELTVEKGKVNEVKGMRKLYRRLFPDRRERLMRRTEGPVYVDEDEYWINGYYDNPWDNHKSIEKRVGIGTTMNMAYKRNRWISFLAFASMVLFMGGLVILLFKFDFATFRINIGKDEITIDAPVYKEHFKTRDMVEVAITEVLPKEGLRTGGVATSRYYLGNFNLDQYGKSRVYLYIQHLPYLVIHLKDRTILFNTKSREQTLEYYRQLAYLIEDNKILIKSSVK